MAPIEGRGVIAHFDHRTDQLVIHTASQMPHIVRNGLSECLGIAQERIRIVSPDVGGGFGYKAILLAEEVCLGWLALRRRPSLNRYFASLSALYLVALGVAWWAMSAKPGA